MATIDSMFKLGIELRNEMKFQDAINVFTGILTEYPTHTKRAGVHVVLGGIYHDLGELEQALYHFVNATQISPNYELASLGVYATLVDLDRDVEAIHELIRYLNNWPANHYKDTLEELLEGLEKGFMTNFENEIRSLARKNGFNV